MSEEKEIQPAPIEVPLEALSSETLQAVIESFILREGTDYGLEEVDHQEKIEQILRQLRAGKVRIAFDPSSESVTLVTEREWKRMKA